MRRVIGGVVAGLLAINGISGAWAGECALPAEMAALQTAALQQELMVAAFSCRDIDLYNRFVIAHQPDLIASDARLKAFFVQHDARHSEAGYHAYKTELANASSLRSIRQTDAFCADAESEFRLAGQPVSLTDVADAQLADVPVRYRACTGSTPLQQTATATPLRRPELMDHPADRHGDDALPEDSRSDADIRHVRYEHLDNDAGQASSAERASPAPHHEIEADNTL